MHNQTKITTLQDIVVWLAFLSAFQSSLQSQMIDWLLRLCQPDNGNMDSQSQIKVHTTYGHRFTAPSLTWRSPIQVLPGSTLLNFSDQFTEQALVAITALQFHTLSSSKTMFNCHIITSSFLPEQLVNQFTWFIVTFEHNVRWILANVTSSNVTAW